MNKKYIVRLTAKERRSLREIVRKLNGSSQKVRRVPMLSKADAVGPAWTSNANDTHRGVHWHMKIATPAPN